MTEEREIEIKKSWQEFRDSGLLWWINMILHTFGWAIIIKMDNGKIEEIYPSRVKFRGFEKSSNDKGYLKVSKFMNENASELLEETEEGL